MMSSPPTVRAKKKFTRLVKGTALVCTTLHMGSWAYSSFALGDLSTERFLTEEEDQRALREVLGHCSLDWGSGNCQKVLSFMYEPDLSPPELDALVTPDFCIDRTDWWVGSPQARFCEGGFVGTVCPPDKCIDRAGIALTELEPETPATIVNLDNDPNVQANGVLVQDFDATAPDTDATAPDTDATAPDTDATAPDTDATAPDTDAIAQDNDVAQGDVTDNNIAQGNDGNPNGNDGNAGVNGDPLFVGIRGQVFKFDGKSDTWYANLATESVQWNLLFNEFDTCPEHENMFVTKASVSLRNSNNQITVGVLDKDNFLPGCADNTVCLGEGSLGLEINGHFIRSPGEYELANNAGRVVIHNTYASCSRKWYDYVVSTKNNLRNLISNDYQESAMDLLLKHKGEMLDPEDCQSWVENRRQNGDLFSQNGSWTTVHVETNDISLHMEYRQANDACNSHLIDAWISKISPELLAQEWKGILGETRYPKLNADGSQIESDRNALLAGQNDADYEVEGPYEINFAARDIFSVDSPSIAIE